MKNALNCLLLMFIASQAFAQNAVRTSPMTISADEAKSLVRVVLRHEHIKLSSKYCNLETVDKEGQPFLKDYYSFAADCDYPNSAATTAFGIFVVSPRTGEVFKFDQCEPFRFVELRQLQGDITRRTHQKAADEPKYREQAGCTTAK